MQMLRWMFVVVMVGVGVCAAVGEPAGNSAAATCGTALLVIDVQNAYIPLLGLFTVDNANLVDRLVSVIAEARAASLPIVYIKQSEDRFSGGSPLGDIASLVAPLDGDSVIWKPQANAFAYTELDGILKGMGVSRLLITGLATHGCVNGTIWGALRLGYETWVVADAHSGSGGPGVAAYYNADWPTAGVHVVSSTDIDFSSFGCAGSAVP